MRGGGWRGRAVAILQHPGAAQATTSAAEQQASCPRPVTTRPTGSIPRITPSPAGPTCFLNAVSSARIIAVSAGIALGGLGAVDATTNGNFIANTVTTGIENGSKVHAGSKVGLSASDSSNITALGLSFSGSGGIAGAVVFAKNDIGNTISSRIAGSTILTGSDLTLDALSNASILSFVGGVAVSGLASVTLSLTINDIHNTVQASILGSGGVPSYVSSGILNASGTGKIDLTATDTSKIDSIAIGLSGSLLGAAGVATAKNFIGTQRPDPSRDRR